jgi:hypothetical protein
VRFAIVGQFGIATPLGGLGVAGDISPIPYLSFELGAGSNFLGPQFAALTRLRLPLGSTERSLFFGFGYSQGRHKQDESNRDGAGSLITGALAGMGHSTPRGHTWDTARWFNLELGGDEITFYHLDTRAFVGVALLLNPGDGSVDPATDTSQVLSINTQMVYFGIAFGFSS